MYLYNKLSKKFSPANANRILSNDQRNVPSSPRMQVESDMIASIFRTGTLRVEPALWSDIANLSHVLHLDFTITHHIANILDKRFPLRIVV